MRVPVRASVDQNHRVRPAFFLNCFKHLHDFAAVRAARMRVAWVREVASAQQARLPLLSRSHNHLRPIRLLNKNGLVSSVINDCLLLPHATSPELAPGSSVPKRRNHARGRTLNASDGGARATVLERVWAVGASVVHRGAYDTPAQETFASWGFDVSSVSPRDLRRE